jgi:signal peptidase II
LGLLGLLLVQSRRNDYLRLVSLSLVVAGAVGNLYDRVRWSRGVVDFIGPVNLGFAHFPIFNVADIAITCGAALLAISFWLEERQERRLAAAGAEAAVPPP